MLWSFGTLISTSQQVLSSFFHLQLIQSSGYNLEINLYFEILKVFYAFPSQRQIMVYAYTFCIRVKFRFFAQFPVNPLTHLVMPSLELFFLIVFYFYFSRD